MAWPDVVRHPLLSLDGPECRMTAAVSALDLLRPVDFSVLPGWMSDHHAEAWAAFFAGCRRALLAVPKTRSLRIDGLALGRIAEAAVEAGPDLSDTAARSFFERHFEPTAVETSQNAFLTGYFEPEIDGSGSATDRFCVPLHRRPDDLVAITDANRPATWDPALAFGRKTTTGILPYHDRAMIENGALAGRGLELAFVESPIDAYFIHVQGSARIRLPNGDVLRIAYDGKAGWPYTSLGRLLIERGEATAQTMTGDRLRQWLERDPEQARALMQENRSYIFFKELKNLVPSLGAVGAADVQLTPGRSLAVDRTLHTFGTPIFINAALPWGREARFTPFQRLMIAQDTGSAIVGPARGDIFVGSGLAAGRAAGLIRHVPDGFFVLRPREP
jgi:membrane-bound lytic murein transglycosylase A